MPDPELDVSGFMLASMELGIKSVSWEMVKIELSKDREFQDLADWIPGGCLGPAESLTDYIKQFRRVRHLLRVMDQVPMLGERTVLPKELRRQVLETLHSTHQGVFRMGLGAEESVYCPGFWSDIEKGKMLNM